MQRKMSKIDHRLRGLRLSGIRFPEVHWIKKIPGYPSRFGVISQCFAFFFKVIIVMGVSYSIYRFVVRCFMF